MRSYSWIWLTTSSFVYRAGCRKIAAHKRSIEFVAAVQHAVHVPCIRTKGTHLYFSNHPQFRTRLSLTTSGATYVKNKFSVEIIFLYVFHILCKVFLFTHLVLYVNLLDLLSNFYYYRMLFGLIAI